jgi:hypothetical protein
LAAIDTPTYRADPTPARYRHFVKPCKQNAVKTAFCLDSILEGRYRNQHTRVTLYKVDMQEKHKVTLYLPHGLHRQLKVRSAVDGEAMSALAERALDFYLTHSEVVEGLERHGQSHRVYQCPSCSTPVVLRENELMAVESHTCLHEESLMHQEVPDLVPDSVRSDEGELVPC